MAMYKKIQTQESMEFGYWNIKGIAEPLRWIFLHFKIDVKEWNPADQAEWEKKAETLGPLANLPYLKDGDLVISEASKIPSAIPRYLIEKAGQQDFLGKTIAERAQVNMIDGILADIRQKCINIIEMPKDADHKAAVQNLFDPKGEVCQRIKVISEMLGEKEFLFGQLTLADFMLTFTARFTGAICYSLLGYSPYALHKNIVALMFAVSELPGIKQRLDTATRAPYLPADIVPFKFLNFQEMIDRGMNPI